MNPELLEAARALGENLHQSEPAKAYLKAKAVIVADPQLTEQEMHLLNIYRALVLRQQNGEQFTNQEVQEYNQLREDVQNNPLIRSRDSALGTLKNLFSAAANEITNQLGVDFTKLALAPEN